MSEPLIVDGDGHTMEPDALWLERMDRSRWGDWVPRKVVEDQWYETNWVGGEIRGGGRELTDELCQTFGITPEEFWHMTESLKLAGGYDPDARIADMDRDGLDVAVLYPSMSLFFGPVLGITRSSSYEDAIRLVNENRWGNGTAVFTNDGGAARKFQNEVQVGMVGINVPIPVPLSFYSFGGWKQSIFGDHAIYGPEGVRFYTKPKVVIARLVRVGL